jgi:hypothetical protein
VARAAGPGGGPGARPRPGGSRASRQWRSGSCRGGPSGNRAFGRRMGSRGPAKLPIGY